MNNSLMVKITFALLGFACMADLVIIPAFGGIYTVFKNENPFLLDFFFTGPLLTAVFSSLLCGYFAKYISKKYLLIGAYIMLIIASCGGALFVNIYYMVVMRALVGFAYGIVPVAAMGLIAEVYVEEKERSFMVGLFNGTISAIGITVSFVSGFLAVSGWQNSFYIYLAGIPILLMMMAYLPKTPPEGAEKTINEEGVRERMPIGQMSTMAITCFLVNALYCIICYYVAIYLKEIQLGDSSVAGILTSITTIGGVCISLFFSAIYLRIKEVTLIAACLVMGAAYIVLGSPANIWVVGAMCLIAGASYKLTTCYFFMHTSTIVPAGQVSPAMSIISIAMNVGAFCSAYALSIYKSILHVETMAPTFLYIGITLGVIAVVLIILNIRSGKTLNSQDFSEKN